MLFFMQPADGNGPVNIGYASDVASRHRQLQEHYGRPLPPLAVLPGDRVEEARLHARFAHLRHGRTEQFRPGPEIASFLVLLR